MKAISFMLFFAGVLACIAGALAYWSTGDGAAWWIDQALRAGVTQRWLLTPSTSAAKIVGGCGFALVVLGMALDRKRPVESTSHGSAAFATTRHLRSLGYSEASVRPLRRLGVALGMAQYPRRPGVIACQEVEAVVDVRLNYETGKLGRFVRKTAPRVLIREDHVAVVGPPGAGKDQFVALPNLYYYPGAVVVTDPKGDQYDATAGARSVFSHVLRFAPTEQHSDRFNPLCVIPLGTPEEVGEAERISNALLGVLKDEKDASMFYAVAAQPLLTAAILYVLHNGKGAERSLPGALRLITGNDKPLDAVARICGGLPQSAAELRDSLARLAQDKRTLESMFTTCANALSFCRNVAVASAISESDFVPTDLYNRAAPASLYLVLPFKDSDQLRPLMRLVINVLVSSHGAGERRHNTLYLLNEFPSLGAIPAIPRAAAEIRSFGVQFCLFWQSNQQILATYGRELGNAIFDMCKGRVFIGLTGDDATTAVSELAGKTTLTKERKTKAVSRKSFFERTETHTEGSADQARELLTANEVRKLAPDKVLVSLPYSDLYIGKATPAYSDPRYALAFKTPAPQTYRAQPASRRAA